MTVISVAAGKGLELLSGEGGWDLGGCGLQQCLDCSALHDDYCHPLSEATARADRGRDTAQQGSQSIAVFCLPNI